MMLDDEQVLANTTSAEGTHLSHFARYFPGSCCFAG